MTILRTFLFAAFAMTPAVLLGQEYGSNAPESISFQGTLADSSGALVPDGNYNLLFKMYKGSSKVWEQNHLNVPIESGGFGVILSGSSMWPLDTVAFNQPIDLGITINGGTELIPRTPLTSAAYALGLRGLTVVHAEDADNRIAPNLIGGALNNYVAPDIVGATVGGGGGWSAGTPSPNSVVARWATVGGGRSNTAGGEESTVGGGERNDALARSAVVGGGFDNTASGTRSTVAGGGSNVAGADASTVGGGVGNTASARDATVGGGESNQAVGNSSTVPGGKFNTASGSTSFAAGQSAKAIHNGTFVWADSSSGGIGTPFTSTGFNQFLIRASGGVGIGTNAPSNQLSVVGSADFTGNIGIGTDSPTEALHITRPSGGGNGIKLGAPNSYGRRGIIFEDSVANRGVSLFWKTSSNQLVLERGSAGTSADSADVFVYDRDDDSFKFNGGNVVLSRAQQASSHQLELRNVGNITSTNYDGIRFSQGSTGSTTLGLIKVLYHNTGITDMSLGLRFEADLLYLDDPAAGAGNGRVGIGTTTPSEKLEVNGNVLANNVSVPSDRRLKRNIRPVGHSLETITRLDGVSYEWRTDEYPDRAFEDGRHIGFIAQDVEDVVPEAVRLGADGTYSMRYQEIIPILVEAIKEQQQTIGEQHSIISRLDDRLAAVEAKLTN